MSLDTKQASTYFFLKSQPGLSIPSAALSTSQVREFRKSSRTLGLLHVDVDRIDIARYTPRLATHSKLKRQQLLVILNLKAAGPKHVSNGGQLLRPIATCSEMPFTIQLAPPPTKHNDEKEEEELTPPYPPPTAHTPPPCPP